MGAATSPRGFEVRERMTTGPGLRDPRAVRGRFRGGGGGAWALCFAEVLDRELGWTRCMDGGHEMAWVPSPVVRQGRQLARGRELGRRRPRVRVVHGCMKRCQRWKKWAGFCKVSSRI